MLVQALTSFVALVGGGQSLTVRAGDVVEMPEGADWERAGLVAPVPPVDALETADVKMDDLERAVTRKKRGS
jgi:hypothetical protein